MRKILAVMGGFALSVVAVETVARLTRATDFPVYQANNRSGYVPKPHQSGSFLWKNDWVINDRGMGTATDFIAYPDGEDILLIGDSVVWGGNPYRAEDRLPARLTAALGTKGDTARVWPIAAGSWALVNQLNWMADNPDVVDAAETVVMVLNRADFGEPSSWRDPLIHPQDRPWSAAAYLIDKYLRKPKAPGLDPALAVAAYPPAPGFADFVTGCDCRVVVWLHPDVRELSGDTGEIRVETLFADLLANSPDLPVEVHQVRNLPDWKPDLYRDTIHPSPEGMAVLARGIADALIPAR